MKNISEAALLVQMQISQWGAQTTDRHLSTQIANEVKGERGAYRVVKQIIPKRFLDPIHNTTYQLRKTFRRYTLPWWQDGTGILPLNLHDKFMQEYLNLQQKLESQVEELVSSMPTIRHAAQVHTGEGFNPDDIPSDSTLRRMFTVRLRFMPVPTANDFRIQMNEDTVEAIKTQYRQDLEEQVAEGTAHAFERVVQVLDTMVDGLERHGDIKPGAKKSNYFKESVVTNVHELSEILDDLNVTGDVRLRDIASDIRTKINGVGVKDLREDRDLRLAVAEDAKEIREQAREAKDSVSSFFGV